MSQLPSESGPGQKSACTVRRNKLRHTINSLQIERFARSRRQKTFIFPARHTRRRKTKRWRDLNIDKLLEVQDNSETKGPGLLMYTQDMPVVALSNISSRLGIVNGAQCTAVGVVPYPGGMLYSYFITLRTMLTAYSKLFSDR